MRLVHYADAVRTTLAIDDQLLIAARQRARERGQTLGQVVEDALRSHLAGRGDAAPVPIPVFSGGGGPRPGVDLTSNRALREALDADLELERLR